jgi:hypothetical protein
MTLGNWWFRPSASDALVHASLQMTEKYAHVIPGDAHNAVLRMASAK